MAKKSNRRAVHGVLVLDKPLGLSSNQALQRAKFLFNAAKAGHTGALDPLASGVLPLCFGEATKFSQTLLESDKTYLARFQLGLETESGDMDAPVVRELDASNVTEDQVQAAISRFRGSISQVPPMYSALKHNGQPLYKLARNGEQVERKPRDVTIYRYDLVSFRAGGSAEVDVVISCSKGTYIRSLALDLGYALGVGATVTQLRRSQAGPYDLTQAVTLEQLAEWAEHGTEALDCHLQPVDSPIADLAKVVLPASSSHYFCQGQAVTEQKVYRFAQEGDKVRVFCETGAFLGLGEVHEAGRLAPKRVIVS